MSARSYDLGVLALGIAAVSTAAVLIREADAPALIIAMARTGLAVLPLLLLAGLRRETAPEPADDRALPMTVLSGVFLSLHFGFWVASVQQTSIVASVVLVTTVPLFIAAVSGPLLGEWPSRGVWVAVVVATAGALLLVSEDFDAGGDTLTGDLYALLGAIFCGGYILTGRRVLARRNDWLRYTIVTYGVAALLLGLAALVNGNSIGGLSGRTWGFLAAIALVPQLIGHTALNRSLGKMPATVVAIAILAEPVGATALAAIFLSEQPTLVQVAGSAIVLAGVAVGLRSDASRERAVAVGESLP